jgi:hypothetical protein
VVHDYPEQIMAIMIKIEKTSIPVNQEIAMK